MGGIQFRTSQEILYTDKRRQGISRWPRSNMGRAGGLDQENHREQKLEEKMKKNISINIGGIIFHIEEDGYEKLKNYLDSVNKYFSSFEDSKEIIEDIEGRIAEIFLSKLDEGKQIINKEDIDDLIMTMGTTKDFEATIENEPEEPEKKDESTQEEKQEQTASSDQEKSKRFYRDNKRRVLGGVASGLANYFGVDPIWIRLLMLAFLFNIFFWGLSGFIIITYIILWIAIPGSDNLDEDKTVKKLYRNSDDRVLGGVSGGIASYFGMDPVVIRVLFVISIFLGGAGLIAYIILWIITPEARTITEKMQMQGEPVTISNIEENLKKSFNVKEGDEGVFVKILLFPFRLIATIFNALGQIIGPFLKFLVEALRIAAGVFFVFMGFIGMLAFTISLVVLIGLGGAVESWVSFGDIPAEQLFNSMSTLAIISAYLVVMVPSLAVSLLGLVIILKRKVTSAFVAWSLFALWLIGMIGIAFSVPAIVRDYSADGSFKEERTYLVSDNTPTLMLNDLDLNRYRSVDLRIRGHEDSLIYLLELDFESRGSSRSDAKNNAEAIDYVVESKNGDFIFDSDITFGDAPFRFQDVSATFYIPYGKVFRMDYELRNILRNTLWMYDYTSSDIEGNDWAFDRSGKLNCLTCESDQTGDSYERGQLKKQGTNNSQVYDFRDFDEIKLISLFDFDITRGNDFQVQLEGDDEELDEVYLQQRDGALEIRYKRDWDWWKESKRHKKIKVFIQLPKLSYLEVSGACEGDIRDFSNSDIQMEITGASKVRADITPRILEADLSGASELTLIGSAEDFEAELNGASKISAFDFIAENVNIQASGASNAKVYASNELTANASGASSVRYRGTARISSDNNGLSSIIKD